MACLLVPNGRQDRQRQSLYTLAEVINCLLANFWVALGDMDRFHSNEEVIFDTIAGCHIGRITIFSDTRSRTAWGMLSRFLTIYSYCTYLISTYSFDLQSTYRLNGGVALSFPSRRSHAPGFSTKISILAHLPPERSFNPLTVYRLIIVII